MRPRRALVRTEESRSWEDLGLKLGRVCMASPVVRAAVLDGFSLALREQTAGRVSDPAADVRELGEAGERLALRHGVPSKRRAPLRRARRGTRRS